MGILIAPMPDRPGRWRVQAPDGRILDDAHGHGYHTPDKAWHGWKRQDGHTDSAFRRLLDTTGRDQTG